MRLAVWTGSLLAMWGVGFAAMRLTIAAPEQCGPIDVASARTAVVLAADWLERAVKEDGTYVYEYDRIENDEVPGYNLVRHAGVTMSLYQLAATGDLSVLPAADRALDYMVRNLVETEDGAAFAYPRAQAKLGASALMLAALDLRREATGDEQHDETMREVGRFLVSMQLPDGSFLAYWDPGTGRPVPGETSKYATGEAFWALAMLHEHFPGEGWDGSARSVSHYLATERDEAEDFDFPPWADQWAAYGLSEIVDWGLTEEEVEYARSLAGRFGFLVRAESRKGEDDLFWMLKGPVARGAGAGTWIEGLTSLWIVARGDERLADIEDDIASRAICGSAILAGRQATTAEAGAYEEPGLVAGGWFTDDVTRMDDQQHALSGILRTIPILEEEAAR